MILSPFRSRARLAFLAMLALANLSGSADRPGLSGPEWSSRMVTRRAPIGPGRYALEIDAAGHGWYYQAQVPEGRGPWPLVVVLHGAGQIADHYLDEAGWGDLATREGFLVAAPNAQTARPGFKPNQFTNPRLWNSGQHAPNHPRRSVDDVRFFRALLEDVADRWPVDPDRVYVVGHSNGGAMAMRLGVELADRVAAVASVSGLHYLVEPIAPHPPRPALFIGGTSDPILPLEGGRSVLPWEVRITPPVRDNLAAYSRTALGAPADPPRVTLADGLVEMRWRAGPSGADLTAIFVEGHGHAWPGAKTFGSDHPMGPDHPTIDATERIWNFLREQRRTSLRNGNKDRLSGT